MLFQGKILSAIPCKGYAFIRPIWAKETDGSSKNIYCYYASEREKSSRRCFINILDKSHPELHEVKKNKRGEEIYLPVGEPQTVWFEAVLQNYNGNYKLMAINLVDEKHITEEEKAEAEKNISEPDFTDEQSLVIAQPVDNDGCINAILMSLKKAEVKEEITEETSMLLPMIITPVTIVAEEKPELLEVICLGAAIETPIFEAEKSVEEVVEFSEPAEEVVEEEYEEDKYSEYYDDYDYDCCTFVKNRSKKKNNSVYKSKGHQSKHGCKSNKYFDDEEEDY